MAVKGEGEDGASVKVAVQVRGILLPLLPRCLPLAPGRCKFQDEPRKVAAQLEHLFEKFPSQLRVCYAGSTVNSCVGG